jgi:hypothetical protein
LPLKRLSQFSISDLLFWAEIGIEKMIKEAKMLSRFIGFNLCESKNMEKD